MLYVCLCLLDLLDFIDLYNDRIEGIYQSMNKFSLDHLDEIRFENFCYEVLQELGFRNLNWRKGTGLNASPADSGRDIECYFEKTDVDDNKYIEKWFVECKHHKKGIPPQAI